LSYSCHIGALNSRISSTVVETSKYSGSTA